MKTSPFLLYLPAEKRMFMKNLLYTTLIGCAVALLSACSSLQLVTFDRLQAADVNFPEQIRSIGVVNYVPSISHDDRHEDLWEGDGKLATEVLAQEIAATNYFEQVVICDSALWNLHHPTDWRQSVPQEQVDSLIQQLGVDLLLAMERVQVQLKNGKLFVPEMMADMHVVDGIVTPLIRAYVSGREVPLFSISKTDTICWELTPGLTYEQMVRDASEHAARMPVTYLLPHWKTMERYYFDGGNVEMRDAGVCVREQDWEQAGEYWQRVYDMKKGKTKMKAAYNLALYYELQDDVKRAKEYLDVAASLVEEGSWEQQLIVLYQMKLSEISKQSQHLKIQMKRFEP